MIGTNSSANICVVGTNTKYKRLTYKHLICYNLFHFKFWMICLIVYDTIEYLTIEYDTIKYLTFYDTTIK